MTFRGDPLTSATALETGAEAPGVRIYASGNNPASGIVEWHAGAATVRGTLTAGDTGSGGYAFTLGGGAKLSLNTEEIPGGGGYRTVFRPTADYVDLGPVARLRQTVAAAGSSLYAAGFGTIYFQVADQDSHHGFSAPAGFSSVWTVPAGQSGLYEVEGRVAVLTVNPGNAATCRLLVDGVAVQGSVGDLITQASPANSLIPNTGSQLLPLAAGQTVELQGFCSGQSWGTRVTTSDGVASTLTLRRVA